MNKRATALLAAALCLALAACNASGRPKNAPKVAEPVAAVRPAADPASYGKVAGSDYVVAPGDTLARTAAGCARQVKPIWPSRSAAPLGAICNPP